MRSKITAAVFGLACLTLPFASATFAQETSDAGWTGDLTPKLLYFDYSGGPGEGWNHFLERYQVRDGVSGDQRSGLDIDLDLDLTYSKGSRDLFTLDRRGRWPVQQLHPRPLQCRDGRRHRLLLALPLGHRRARLSLQP